MTRCILRAKSLELYGDSGVPIAESARVQSSCGTSRIVPWVTEFTEEAHGQTGS